MTPSRAGHRSDGRALVAPYLEMEDEALAHEGADDLPSGQTAQLAQVDCRRSAYHGHQWFLRKLNVCGNGVALFEPCLTNHLDDFLVRFACFLLGLPPRGGAIREQGRTMGRPPICSFQIGNCSGQMGG